MHDGWRGKLIPHTAILKLASASGYYVPDKFAFPSVGERNEESVRRSEHIHWRPVNPARLSTYMRKDAEARQSVSESTCDSVRNSEIESCHPSFAKPDQEDRSQQDCEERDDRCGDQHDRLSSLNPCSCLLPVSANGWLRQHYNKKHVDFESPTCAGFRSECTGADAGVALA
jgi:hypothetical protein